MIFLTSSIIINVFLIILICIYITYPSYSQPAMGYLDIVTDVQDVEIYINSKFKGRTPLTGVEVGAGTVQILATKKGYGTATKTITVAPDDVVTIRIPLGLTTEVTGERRDEVVIEQDRGALLVINQLGQIPVAIDGKRKGSGSVSITGISTGEHKLQVGRFLKNIDIYKNHKLKAKVTSSGILVLNDPEQQRQLEKERKSKEEERQRKAEQEKRLNDLRTTAEVVINLQIEKQSLNNPTIDGLSLSVTGEHSEYVDDPMERKKRGFGCHTKIVGSWSGKLGYPDPWDKAFSVMIREGTYNLRIRYYKSRRKRIFFTTKYFQNVWDNKLQKQIRIDASKKNYITVSASDSGDVYVDQ